MNTRIPGRWIVLLLLAGGLGAFLALDLGQYLTLEYLQAQRDGLVAWSTEHKTLAVLGYFGVYVLMAALSVPGAAVMTIAGGALFGLALGSLVVSFASTVGATLVFLAARYLFRDTVQRRFEKRLKTVNEGVDRDGAFYLLALRLVPAFPFWAVNLLMALSSIRPWTFYWVSQLGMLPATLAFVNAGTQLAEVDTLGDVLSPSLLGAFAILGLLPLALRLALRLVQSRSAYRSAYRGYRKPAAFDYNLVVIGAGAAGLVTAYIGAAVRARVAVIEKDRMGGDCLNTGCVPSKALIRTARLLAEARDSRRFGIREMQADFSFRDVMDRVRDVIRRIEPHDSRERYEKLGVDVIDGHARLLSPWEVAVGDRVITARSIVLASGAEPLVPDIPGLNDVEFLTSDTLWDLQTAPKKLVVLGGGAIGAEMTQAFSRLGSRVTVVESADHLLPREDIEAGRLLADRLTREGVEVAVGHRAVRVERTAAGGRLICRHGEHETAFEFDRLLVALGRKARTEGFGLRELGIELADRGTIAVDGFQRTNVPNVYVCGDAAGPYQFTHVAAHQAWYAAVNALLSPLWSFRTDYRVIPRVTFTDPEIASVGLSEVEAQSARVAYEVTRYGLDDLDRAIADGADYGYVKVLTPPGKDKLLGVTIVGAHAGELLPEFVLAMKHGLGLNKVLGTIHAYPTFNEANKYAAGVWKQAHAPAGALRLAERFFTWRRGRGSPRATPGERAATAAAERR